MPGMSAGVAKAPSGSMAGMDHSNMSGMSAGAAKAPSGSMAGMDHSNMPGMSRSVAKPGAVPTAAVDHAAMGHAVPPAPARTQPAASQAMAGMDHSRMNMPSGVRSAATPSGMDHAAMAARPSAIAEFGGDPADDKLSRIVALLVRDSIVVSRINANPDLRRAWQDPAVRRLIVNTPDGQ